MIQAPAVPEFSKAVFGNRHFFEVVVAVAEHPGDIVYAREIGAGTGLADTVVRDQLRRLASGGLLQSLGRPGGNMPFYYERLPSEFWRCALRLRRELEARRLIPNR